ncbi:MAG: hypothetical protein HQL56_02460 [Magnetococcales bacterium]|nr:hypothetical protein [Magnetococcales bacterium]
MSVAAAAQISESRGEVAKARLEEKIHQTAIASQSGDLAVKGKAAENQLLNKVQATSASYRLTISIEAARKSDIVASS